MFGAAARCCQQRGVARFCVGSLYCLCCDFLLFLLPNTTSQHRANHRLDLDDIELPENHPWATRKPVRAYKHPPSTCTRSSQFQLRQYDTASRTSPTTFLLPIIVTTAAAAASNSVYIGNG